MWKRVVCSIGVAFVLVLPGSLAQGAHCGGMTDMYVLAQCEGSHTSGAAAPGMIQSTIGSVPQYGGSPTCQTGGCSGAPQESYFNTTGDVSALNNDGATAAATDPRMGELQSTRTAVQGWNLTTSAPVLTSATVAASVTAPPVTESCTDVRTCNAWSEGPPSTETCTVPGSAMSICQITVVTTARTLNYILTVPSPLPTVGWSTPHSVFVSLRSLGGNNYEALIGRGHGSVWGWYSLYTFTAPDPGLASDEIVVQSGISVNITVQGDGGPGCGTWTGNVPLGAVWEVLGCSAPGDQGGWARLNSGTGFYHIRKDVISDGCGGLRATWSLISSTCNDTVPRSVTTDTGTVLVLPPPATFPLNSCWDRTESYGYQGLGPNTCAPLLQRNCSQTSSVCTSPLPGGCDTYTNTMSCPGGSVCTAETVVRQCTTCGAPDSLVPFCVDASTPPNTNLANAATWLAMLDSIKNDWDPATLRIFTGARMSCDYDTLGSVIVNCCNTDPSTLIGSCTDEEIQLAKDRQFKKSHYIGDHCVTTGPFGICLRKEEVYCSYTSQLARMIHDQGQPQLGMTWGTADAPICDGFSVAQFTAINWSLIDFSEWYSNVSASIDPVGITNSMTTRICAATGSC